MIDAAQQSHVLEALPDYVRKREAEAWLERNRASMEKISAFTPKHGMLTESRRIF